MSICHNKQYEREFCRLMLAKGYHCERIAGSGKADSAICDCILFANGNVYVTGTLIWGGSYADYLTVKYDTNGNLLWDRRYDGSALDSAAALVVDSSDNVYVTGTINNVYPANSADYATVKYDTNGNELWVKQYDNGYQDSATALVVDSSDNVYVTGASVNGCNGSADYATVKYNANGDELWVKRYDGDSRGSWDQPAGAAVDASGNVYITGWSYYGNPDYTTIKYNQVVGTPKTPAELMATAISWNRINLSWTDNSTNEDGFKIMRAETSDGLFTVIATIAANSTGYQDTGLLPETTYYYKLVAFNANGGSGYANVAGSTGCGISNVASSTTLQAPPDAEGPSIMINESQQTIWPPNGKMVNVALSGVITDISGVTSASYMVHDEYGLVEPSGNILLAGDGSYTITISLKASRLGSDADGRVYTVYITAVDALGNTSTTSSIIIVPHDQSGI